MDRIGFFKNLEIINTLQKITITFQSYGDKCITIMEKKEKKTHTLSKSNS